MFKLAWWWRQQARILEFQSLERDSVCSSALCEERVDGWVISFNLLSEILFVQAYVSRGVRSQNSLFQSLERDSVCSSRDHGEGRAANETVSIS